MTARVAAIWRHPIKAHGRERLREVTLEAGRTLAGDRAWAVTHEATRARPREWSPCSNFTRGAGTPSLMAIEARTLPDGLLALSHPERPELVFETGSQAAEFVKWVMPLMPEGRAAPVGLVPAPDGQGMTDAGEPWLAMFGIASHLAVSKQVGQDISTERWRANLIVDGLAPWAELDLIGEEVAVGGAVITVRERIERCLATAANPATGRRDADTLGALEALPGWLHPIRDWPRVVFLQPLARGRENVTVGPFAYYDDPDHRRDFFDRNVMHHYGDHLTIGAFAAIAEGVRIVMNGANHDMAGFSTFPFDIFEGWGPYDHQRYAAQSKGDTVIGPDVWIGAEAWILPGVTIGAGAIVAAKSVVGRDVPPFSIAAGNPARVVRHRFEPELTRRLLAIAWWDWPVEKITRNRALIMSNYIDALEAAE
jgi:acetyltransferase-like isoleucine patch superfamily enzyme/uncharacterized protein YcbX